MPALSAFRVANLDRIIQEAKANGVVSRAEASGIGAYAETATHPSSRAAVVDRLSQLEASGMVRDPRALSRLGQSIASVAGRSPSAARCQQLNAPSKVTDEQMLSRLRHALPEGAAAVLASVEGQPEKLALLRSPDLAGSGTVFEHIIKAAEAPAKANLLAGPEFAKELLEMVVLGQKHRAGGACYGETIFHDWVENQPAELVRILGELGTRGRTELASGQIVKWNQGTARPMYGNLNMGALWSGLTTTLRLARVKNPCTLTSLDDDDACKGQMANLMTRLTGKRYVNVTVDLHLRDRPNDTEALQRATKVWDIVDAGYLVLAEFGCHGGSANRFDPARGFYDTPAKSWERRVGYMAVPVAQAREKGLETMDLSPYDAQERYLSPRSLKLHSK